MSYPFFSVLFMLLLLSNFSSCTTLQTLSESEMDPKFNSTWRTYSGKRISLPRPTPDAPLILVFLSSTCPCSESHMPTLKEMAIAFPEFHFIGIHSNQDEDENEAGNFFLSKDLPFEIIRDEKAQLANFFGALKTPHLFIIDSKSQIVYQGGVTDRSNAQMASKNFLHLALNDIKEGHSPEISQAKVLGCTIARKN